MPKKRADSKHRYLDHFNKHIDQYIADYEGTEDDDEELPEELLLAANDLILTDNYKSRPTHDASSTLFTATFFTTHKDNDTNHGPSITMELVNCSISHWIVLLFLKPDLETDLYKTNKATPKILTPKSSHVYLNEGCYSSESFKGIVIDTGAAQLSTAGYGQYLAYKRIIRNIDINTTTAGMATVQFGPGNPYQSIGSIDVPTPIGTIWFYILTTTTPFLISLLAIHFLYGITPTILTYLLYLTTTPAFSPILNYDAYTANLATLQLIDFAVRFWFTLHKDIDFNHSIIINIIYLDGDPVLHIDTLRKIWINTYLGPLDLVIIDARKTFISREFSQSTSAVGTIIKTELLDLPKDAALQMAVKAINDIAGSDGLVPTLLVFGAYPRMAMTEVQDALNTCNGPASTAVHLLPINSDVRVWREGNTGYAGEWKGPYKLLSVEGETCIIQFSDGPKQFCITVVRLYYKALDENDQDTNSEHTNKEPEAPLGINSTPPTPQDDEPDTSTPQARPAQRPQRNRQLPARYRD
ncbi:hypothetical protein TSTA_065960 [Talaromyces stipitatus ATCC 10500]|uniref:Uncharacterized protein n=1 Tax=Talaromyces stipitatus (strain ATCC 10500 / CBS 375.48 / QM 6759 / NRRL 1006) TaxID=441959 RepID=B8LV93_TALSN|nr:uncharacterized protein TSTA_065960 [Talaromyces stipitatus ATCC 10500]EED23143.1 hypothetical protein TSTA_065960 [Talaromyces stipitatus ATCC 10500]